MFAQTAVYMGVRGCPTRGPGKLRLEPAESARPETASDRRVLFHDDRIFSSMTSLPTSQPLAASVQRESRER